MELFDEHGCLTEAGLHAVVDGQLDELGRLEAAEHLAYCDKCVDRYTALLTADVLAEPPRSARGAVMSTIWVRLMQNTWGRAAVAGVAAVLALTMWRTGTLDQILRAGQAVHSRLPESSQSTGQELLGKPVETPAPETPEGPLGKPAEDSRSGAKLSERISDALDSLLEKDSAETTEK